MTVSNRELATQRRSAIRTLFAHGCSPAAIARWLGMSGQAVRNHLPKAYVQMRQVRAERIDAMVDKLRSDTHDPQQLVTIILDLVQQPLEMPDVPADPVGPSRRQRVVAALDNGEHPQAIADREGISKVRVYQIKARAARAADRAE